MSESNPFPVLESRAPQVRLEGVTLTNEGRVPVDVTGVSLAVGDITFPTDPITGAGAGAKTLADLHTDLAAVLAKQAADPATQTTLAAVLAKIIAAPATEATSAAILAKLIAAPATEASLAGLSTKIDSVATQTTLAAILAKIIAAPATEATAKNVFTAPANASVLAGAATVELLATNANRQYALLTNDSDTVVYLGLGAAAVIGKGIRLNANGGSYEVKPGNLFTGAVNGIAASGANKNVCTLEK